MKPTTRIYTFFINKKNNFSSTLYARTNFYGANRA